LELFFKKENLYSTYDPGTEEEKYSKRGLEIPQIAIEKYSVFLMKYQDIDTMSDKNDSA